MKINKIYIVFGGDDCSESSATPLVAYKDQESSLACVKYFEETNEDFDFYWIVELDLL